LAKPEFTHVDTGASVTRTGVSSPVEGAGNSDLGEEQLSWSTCNAHA